MPRPVKGKLATITEPDEIGELLRKIEESEARQTYPVALAFQIAPYVMLRPGELSWRYVGGNQSGKAEWYIKAERMKPGFDYVVPLPLFQPGPRRTHYHSYILNGATHMLGFKSGETCCRRMRTCLNI